MLLFSYQLKAGPNDSTGCPSATVENALRDQIFELLVQNNGAPVGNLILLSQTQRKTEAVDLVHFPFQVASSWENAQLVMLDESNPGGALQSGIQNRSHAVIISALLDQKILSNPNLAPGNWGPITVEAIATLEQHREILVSVGSTFYRLALNGGLQSWRGTRRSGRPHLRVFHTHHIVWLVEELEIRDAEKLKKVTYLADGSHLASNTWREMTQHSFLRQKIYFPGGQILERIHHPTLEQYGPVWRTSKGEIWTHPLDYPMTWSQASRYCESIGLRLPPGDWFRSQMTGYQPGPQALRSFFMLRGELGGHFWMAEKNAYFVDYRLAGTSNLNVHTPPDQALYFFRCISK